MSLLEIRPWIESGREERSPGGRLLPLRVLLFGLTVPLLLRLKLERLASRLEPAAPPPPPADPGAAEALARRIDFWLKAWRPLVRAGCLTRGITQYRFLRRAGFDVSLRFGIGELKGDLDGHCWIVKDGEPFLEKRDPRPLYSETYRIPWEAR
jgi:hypothetical protein